MASNPPISEEDLKKALVEMAAALAQFNAKYAIIGGMAAAYRSQPRFTKDLDILLAIPQLVLPRFSRSSSAAASSSISQPSCASGQRNT
jgi:hypothetical protein